MIAAEDEGDGVRKAGGISAPVSFPERGTLFWSSNSKDSLLIDSQNHFGMKLGWKPLKKIRHRNVNGLMSGL